MPKPRIPRCTARASSRFKKLKPWQETGLFGLTILLLVSAGCSSISGSQSAVNTPPSSNISAPTVSPNNAVVSSGAKLQFVASFANTANTSVVWSASSGTISPSGLFTAPSVSSAISVTVAAASVADLTNTASAALTVQNQSGPAPLAIEKNALEIAILGSSYSASFVATGGVAPYRWTVASGTLPPGVTVISAGALSGTPSQLGTFSFVVQANDSSNHQVTQNFSLLVANSSGYDGPAQLPLTYVQSSLADTPAPGSTIQVNAGGDFQGALNSAECGQTIALQSGSTFTGNFTVPAKSCDDTHWIIIRTSAPDSALPPEGTRINPCYAGIASLPGRPSFTCPSRSNVMAKIVFDKVGSHPVMLASGANHIRFLGLEITRDSPGNVIYELVLPVNGGPADHLVFDRVWIHGTAKDETTRGIALSGSTYVAIVDSYFSDFHCVSISGACGDSQAINGGTGDLPMGPYKIVDNFLEASGQNLMFGGGGGSQNPQDIEIRQNHLFQAARLDARPTGLRRRNERQRVHCQESHGTQECSPRFVRRECSRKRVGRVHSNWILHSAHS